MVQMMRSEQRQLYGKGRAAAGHVPGRKRPAQPFDDRPTDGQPQTQPVGLGGVERLEDLFEVLGGDAGTAVDHRQPQSVALAAGADLDLPSIGRCGDGIADEVLEHLPQAVRVAADRDGRVGESRFTRMRLKCSSRRMRSRSSPTSACTFRSMHTGPADGRG